MYSVLLADDEPIFLDFMKSIIDWTAFSCTVSASVEDGIAAFEYLMKHPVDIAFIDISMPQMDGISICEKVREARLPVKLVIMTGHDEFAYAYKAIKLQIEDYLLKPFTKEELQSSLKRILENMNGKTAMETSAIKTISEGATKYEIITFTINGYLEKEYANRELSLTSIAQDLGFDSSYLRRIYKYTTGMTIMQKLEEIRIQTAKELLEQGEYRNQDIAALTGFSDPFYFSKRFKQMCGVSPSEYRKNGSG